MNDSWASNPDAALVRQLLSAGRFRDPAEPYGIVAWFHSPGCVNSPYRLAPFEHLRGASTRPVTEGMPAEHKSVTVFGLDARGRSVVERVYGADGRLEALTLGSHTAERRSYLTLDEDGTPEFATIESWDGDRLLRITNASAFERFWSSKEFRWINDEIVEVLERSFDAKGVPLLSRVSVDYGADGSVLALTADGTVIWRRREGNAWRQMAREAEEALAAEIRSTLASREWRRSDLVLLLHGGSGAWTDQAIFTAAVPTAEQRVAPVHLWSPAEWDVLETATAARPRTEVALAALDEAGEPKPGEAESLLRIAARVARTRIDGPPLLVVTSVDRDDLDRSLRIADTDL